MAGPPNIGPSKRAKNGTALIMKNRPYDQFGGTRGLKNPDPPGFKDPGDAGSRGGRSSRIYGIPSIGGDRRQNQGQSMRQATKRSPAIKIKMSQRLRAPDPDVRSIVGGPKGIVTTNKRSAVERKPTHGVGGGVISAEPKVSGGGRSDYTPHPSGQTQKVPFTNPKSARGKAIVAQGVTAKPGKRVK